MVGLFLSAPGLPQCRAQVLALEKFPYPLFILLSYMATQFAACYLLFFPLNSKQVRKKSEKVLIVWVTLMLGTALQTRFLVEWGAAAEGACVRWQNSQVDSSERFPFEKQIDCFCLWEFTWGSGNNQGVHSWLSFPEPAHYLLFYLCLHTEKSELLYTAAIFDAQESPRKRARAKDK